MTVLDLGCGTGRDVYLAAQLVGEHGKVIGIDMTDEQLTVARRYTDEQAARYGFAAPNTEFHEAMIEDLSTAGIEDHSIDLVISNCVINLSPNKEAVFKEIFRVLKPFQCGDARRGYRLVFSPEVDDNLMNLLIVGIVILLWCGIRRMRRRAISAAVNSNHPEQAP